MTKQELAAICIARLKAEYPDSDCTLDYDHAWQLLVSVRLAAQCTDARVNVVVQELFAKYPGVKELAAADPADIEAIVKPCGLGHSKARDISACMRMLRDRYDCRVPDDFNALLALPDAPLEGLRQVYSHEQPLHQCSDFLKAHPQLTAHPYSNTAASAKLVAEQKDPSLAAIGSVQCARMYGLQLLMPAIQNRSDNFTRFVILAKQPLHHPDCQRISLIVRVQHRAGALYNALSRFAVRGINLLKLESRPIPDSPFEFLFYWDFDGNLDDERVVQALHQLKEDTQYIQILGNYPEAPFPSPSL